MLSNRNTRLVAITFAAAFLLMAVSPAFVTAADYTWELNIGPYVDKAVFKVISNDNTRALAMLAGDIDLDYSFFLPVHYQAFYDDPDIDIFSALRNGYGHITINCRDPPTNETVLRRAFAFAFDKEKVTSEVLDGYSQEHDSLVPFPSGWCIEEQLTPHYYTAQAGIGNQMLNDSGLFPFDGEGYRTYKGEPFDIEIAYSSDSPEIAGGTAQIGVEALQALHIRASTLGADFNEYIPRLDLHGEYDMIFYGLDFYSYDIDWLAYTFWGEYADTPYQNECNFRNASYDAWRDQLLYGTTYDEIYEAGAAMQRILHEQVPRLICYENAYNMAYRTDKFTGHVPDATRYISGPWTMRKIHELDGTTGGTVIVGISQEPTTFNFFTSNSAYVHAITNNLYPRLYNWDPSANPFPDLATSLLTETHEDNPAVPSGHTRFTLDIIQNATWSDGVQLTAEDVAFALNYYYTSYDYGNQWGAALRDLAAAYAPTPYRVVIEFNTKSYWHFSNFGYAQIIPKHIFNDVDGIGYEGWNTWNPAFDPDEPFVTCGPYEFTSMEAGEFYELSYNPDFYFGIDHPVETTTTTVAGPDWTLALIAGAVGAAVVILVGGFVLFRQK